MLKTILLYYPSFENGGATKNLINITNYFLKKKIKVILFSYKVKNKNFKRTKYLKVIESRPIKLLNFFPIRWNLAISSAYNLNSKIKIYKKNSIIFSMQSHIPAIIIAKINRRKISIRISEDPIGATKYADNKFTAYLVLILKILFYNITDQIIAISKKSKLSLERLIFLKNKIKLIFNPYLKKIYNGKIKKKNKTFNILTAGRITKQKNLNLLIEAVHNLSKKYQFIKLIIIGKGDQYEIVKKRIKNLNFIKILNWKKNLKNFFIRSDLFVLPSFYEGLPNALIDAVNYGIPSIATDVSGSRDILLNGKGGIIIPNNDQITLEKKIEFAIKNYLLVKKKSLFAKKKVYRFGNKNCIKFHRLFIELEKNK